MIGERINIKSTNKAGWLGEARVPDWLLCLFVMGSAFLEVDRVAGHVYTPVMESWLSSNLVSCRIRIDPVSFSWRSRPPSLRSPQLLLHGFPS